MQPSSSAEKAFFDALLDRGSVKLAELAQGTADALGLGSVDPNVLDSLENSAAKAPQQIDEEAEAQEIGPAPQEDLPPEDTDEAPVTVEPDPEPELIEQEPPGRAEFGRLFSKKNVHPLALFDVLNGRYKGDWTQWEPETLWWALRRDFGPVGEIARHKIMALRVAAITDIVWLDWDLFEDSGLAWNDVIPIFGAFQPMNPMQAAFTVHCLRYIRDEEFDNEVVAYIAAILDEYGLVYAPEEYFPPGVQALLDRKEWTIPLRDQVSKMWEKLGDVDPLTVDFSEENQADDQMLKLFAIKAYLSAREASRDDRPGTPLGGATATPPVP